MIPLVLVPGLMCDQAVWKPLLPALSPHAQCLVVDHGQADGLTQMAEQLLAHAPQRFALAGHSMGGRVALEVMRLAPERVTHLGLFDTGHLARASGAAGEEEARKRHLLLDVARTQGVRAMAQQWVQGMVAPQRLDDEVLIEHIVRMFDRKSADIFERQIRALLARPDATRVLQNVRVPSLVLCGEQDSWSPPAQHQAIADLMPAHPSVVRIADSGHMAMMERPESVAQAMLNWLAKKEN
jgi:pimeloyl-ACP methyl ester carboxylesterase